MKSFVMTLRAIGSLLAIRLYVPIVISALIILAVLVAGALWLTTLSDWWWLLFIPLVVLTCVVAAVATVIFLLIRFVRPKQTKVQERAVKQFVDKAQGIVDTVGTPKIIILFRIIRSIAAPSQNSYLSDLVSNRELGKDFRDVQRSFDQYL